MHPLLWTFIPSWSPNVQGGESAKGRLWGCVSVEGKLHAPQDPSKKGRDPASTGDQGLTVRFAEWCDSLEEAERRSKDPLFTSKVILNRFKFADNRFQSDGEWKNGKGPNIESLSYDPALLEKVELGGGSTTTTPAAMQESVDNYA